MARSIRWQNSVLVAAVEAAAGTEQAPGTGTGIACQALKFTYNGNVLTPAEYTGSLDKGVKAIGAVKGRLSYQCRLKGSTAAATLPEFSTLLAGVNLQVTVTAAAVPAGAPEACGVGGSATTVKLGVTAVGAGNDDIYRGMPITLSGAGAFATPVTTIISAYNSTTKVATVVDTLPGTPDATTNYQILANIVIQPVTPDPATWLTQHHYLDGLRRRFWGTQGNAKITLPAGDWPMLDFDFDAYGFLSEDTALITPTFDQTKPAVWKGGVCTIDRLPAACKSMVIDLGNQVAQLDDPNGPQGIALPEITSRDVSITIDPKMTLTATRDVIGARQLGTAALLHARGGLVAGNRWAVTVANAFPTTYGESDESGLGKNQLGYSAATKNAAFQLTLY